MPDPEVEASESSPPSLDLTPDFNPQAKAPTGGGASYLAYFVVAAAQRPQRGAGHQPSVHRVLE